MWLCLNNGFLSIVEDKNNKEYLMVRARDRDSITNVFGNHLVVTETPNNDYRYRVSLLKSVVSKVIAEKITEIDYSNFKNSVEDPELSLAYLDFWQTMYLYQHSVVRKREPRFIVEKQHESFNKFHPRTADELSNSTTIGYRQHT